MKKLFSLFLAAAYFLFPGCATITAQRAPEPVILHAVPAVFAVSDAYQKSGLKFPNDGVLLIDASYIFPTTEMLKDMDVFLKAHQHRDYIDEAWDCDDIAKEWCILSHRWWVKESKGIPVALGTFIVYVEMKPGAFDGRSTFEGKHALGLLRDSEGIWWYIEPRNHWKAKVEESRFEDTIEPYQIVW